MTTAINNRHSGGGAPSPGTTVAAQNALRLNSPDPQQQQTLMTRHLPHDEPPQQAGDAQQVRNMAGCDDIVSHRYLTYYISIRYICPKLTDRAYPTAPPSQILYIVPRRTLTTHARICRSILNTGSRANIYSSARPLFFCVAISIAASSASYVIYQHTYW